MIHLLDDVSSVENQKMAYNVLHLAALRRTEYLVLEAEAGAAGGAEEEEQQVTIELPKELVVMIHNVVKLEGENGENGRDPLAYLLAWMVVFDMFTDAVGNTILKLLSFAD